MVKILLNDDINAFNIHVDGLLQELCIESNIINELNVLDKFFILYSIRAGNVGSVLDFNVGATTGEKVKFSIDILKIIEKIESFDIGEVITMPGKLVEAKISLPKRFFGGEDNIYDCICDCFDSITFKDKTINLLKLTYEERKDVLNRLPGHIIPGLFEAIKIKEEVLNKEPIINIQVPYELPFDKEMHLSILNNSFYELVKLAYSVDLKDFYIYEYNLIKKFKFSYDHINNITPAELHLYFNVISDDLQKEKEEREKQEQTQGTNIPPPNNMPHE